MSEWEIDCWYSVRYGRLTAVKCTFCGHFVFRLKSDRGSTYFSNPEYVKCCRCSKTFSFLEGMIKVDNIDLLGSELPLKLMVNYGM